MSSKNSTKNGKLTKQQIMDTVSSEQFRTKVSDELYEGKDLRVTKDVDGTIKILPYKIEGVTRIKAE